MSFFKALVPGLCFAGTLAIFHFLLRPVLIGLGLDPQSLHIARLVARSVAALAWLALFLWLRPWRN